mmetsp:Transcript_13706/g.38584  ORF Transcript_13706/g.38584 Transcript_13706/m.38584 type:complete len:112 (-) Transcript_13706:7-342(-)
MRGTVRCFDKRVACSCLAAAAAAAEKRRGTADTKLGLCYGCKQPFPFGSLLKCVRCDTVHYCGVDCQRSDWPEHKELCVRKRPRTEAAQAATTATSASRLSRMLGVPTQNR